MSRPSADARKVSEAVDRTLLKLGRLSGKLAAEETDPESPMRVAMRRPEFWAEDSRQRVRVKAMVRRHTDGIASVTLRPPVSVIRRARQNCAGKRRPGVRRVSRASAPPGDPDEPEPGEARHLDLLGDLQLVGSLARIEGAIA
jgi:hypothetical protein